MNPAIISGLANVAGSAINAFSTGRQNKKSRAWSEKMYNRQHEDNLAFWHMQNDYNTPEAQMHRLEQAGLNPHLVYGKGATHTASSIQTPDVQRPEFKTPDISGISSYFGQFVDYEIKKAQADNLRADNTVKLEEAMLKQAQRNNTEQGTKRSKFDLDLDRELRDIYAESRKEQLRKLKSETDLNIGRETREAVLNPYKRNQLFQDARVKRYDANLKKNGIQPSDPLYLRMLGQFLESLGGVGRILNLNN